MKYFRDPEVSRLTLGDGEWLDVKNHLTHEEREGLMSAMSPYVTPGEPLRLERREIRSALVLTYLVGWSLTRGGAPVPMHADLPANVRSKTIWMLDAAAFDAIHTAIDTHVDAMRKADELEKNEPARANAS